MSRDELVKLIDEHKDYDGSIDSFELADSLLAHATAPQATVGGDQLCDRVICAQIGECARDDAATWLKCPHRDTVPQASLTEGQILDLAEDFKSSSMSCGVPVDHFDSIGFARALLTKGS